MNNITNEEFEKLFLSVWNNVGRDLLPLVRVLVGFDSQKSTVDGSDIVSTSDSIKDDGVALDEVPEKSRKQIKKAYAIKAYENRDKDGFIFKRLRDESDNQLIEITIFDDDSCEFTLRNVHGEERQMLKDNMEYNLKDVFSFTGNLTDSSNIVNKKPGTGYYDGKLIKVLSNAEVMFED